MKANKRIVAIVMVVALILTMLFASACIDMNARHDCCGKGCVVCQRIEFCENLLRSLSAAVAPIIICISLCVGLYNTRQNASEVTTSVTLVTLNVKLSN